MAIHVADERQHKPPAGFTWIGAEVVDDHEIQIFEQNGYHE